MEVCSQCKLKLEVETKIEVSILRVDLSIFCVARQIQETKQTSRLEAFGSARHATYTLRLYAFRLA